MIIIKTATGKEFESDYAVTLPNPRVAFIRILGQNVKKVRKVFSNPAEFPIEGFEEFHTMTGVIEEDTAVKIVLKP